MSEDSQYQKIYNLEAEQSLLCCCMIGDPDENDRFFSEAIQTVEAKYFFDPRHYRIFSAMETLFDAGIGWDLIIICDHLERIGELEHSGGETYLTQLLNVVATNAGLQRYAAIVRDYYTLRSTARMFSKGLDLIRDKSEALLDPMKFISRMTDGLINLKNNIKGGTKILTPEIMTDTLIEQTKKRKEAFEKREVIGIPSGIAELDGLTGGFQNGDMIVIAGRPTMGKTDFGINISVNAMLRGLPVGFVSLEMSSETLWIRVSSLFTNIYRNKHLSGGVTDFEVKVLEQRADKLKKLPIVITDTPGMTISDIRSAAMEAKHRSDIKLLVIDYLGLVSLPKAHSTEAGIAKVSKSIKNIAREFNIPVILISQLNRAVEQRKPPRPILSDLRDSGSIEQDADVVIFLYRENYYDKKAPNDLELIIAKQRNGPTSSIKGLDYNRGIGRISSPREPGVDVSEEPEFEYEDTGDLPF